MADSESQHLIQSSILPPAQPAYVLRGHTAQIHSLHFFRENLRLVSGDADGWVVIWDMPIRRPVVVWRAHTSTVLGLGTWGDDKIITHGRDQKLNVWQLKSEDESSFSTILPIDDAVSERKQPWLLHSLTVNALNFCSFTMMGEISVGTSSDVPAATTDNVLVAMPGVQDEFINVIQLPSEDRIGTIPTPKDVKTGMIMAIGLCYHQNSLTVLAGYESGHAAIWQRNTTNHWQIVCVNKAHNQPVLSLDTSSTLGCFFTSSADAIIARHPLPGIEMDSKALQTKHAGQQGLSIRSDQTIFATAGWDGRARVYSTKSMKELAVLKWHKEGCYAIAFSNILSASTTENDDSQVNASAIGRTSTVSERRVAKAKATHWLAAGSKDGKVSLWDIY